MLYIFDLGNAIVDIDFNRVLGAWSDLTRVPLATLKKSFHMGEAFHQSMSVGKLATKRSQRHCVMRWPCR